MIFALDRRRAMRGTAKLTQHGIKRCNMRRGSAATPTNQIKPVFQHEAFHPGGEFFRAQRIMRFAINQFRQAGIGLAGD